MRGERLTLARAELPELEGRATGLLEEVKSRLVNADDRRVGSVILEVRAGTGGDEAALWARDLLGMYQGLAGRRRWAFEMMDMSADGAGAGATAGAAVAPGGRLAGASRGA